MMRTVFSLGSMLLLLTTGPARSEDTLPERITARAWAIADGCTGQLLWGVNEDIPAKAASTTKMMCVWVVLRLAEADPDIWHESVTYSKLAASTGGSSSRLREGERVRVAECLYGLLLPSGNDAGNALAEHFHERLEPPPGDVPQTTRSNFIAEMNRWAERLEMTRTVYRSPFGDGGTAEQFTTTPRDLLRLAYRGMQDERFRQYVGTREHTTLVTTPDGGQREVTWTNTNQLLVDQSFDGIKTGTTNQAGACLVSSGRRGTDHLLVVVLGSSSSEARYRDTKALFEWAWARRP